MPITDPYQYHAGGVSAPLTGGFAATPDDAADLPVLTRALMVGGGGDLAAVLKDGSTVTLPELAPGVVYPVRVARVLATGTSASGIVGLY